MITWLDRTNQSGARRCRINVVFPPLINVREEQVKESSQSFSLTMIDPGYIPEDLTQYLLNYSGQEEEHNSCDDAQLNEVNSSDYGSIFIPPYASTPREPQRDQETFADSGMSEDESCGELSQPHNKSKVDVHNASNSAKEKNKSQQQPADSSGSSTKSDKNRKALAQNNNKKSSEKSGKQPIKVTKGRNGSCHSEKKSAKPSSALVEILRDVSHSSKETKIKKNKKIYLDLTTEDMLGSKESSKKSAKKRPASLDKAKEKSSTNLPQKKKKTTKISDVKDKTSCAPTNQETDEVLAMDIIGDVSSSEDESEVLPLNTVNTAICQETADDCHAETDNISVFLQSNGSKNSRNLNKKINSQATVNVATDESDSSSIHSSDEKNSTTDTKELSKNNVSSVPIDISSTENQKTLRVTPKGKGTSAKTTEDTQESKTQEVNDKTSKCSKPKGKCTEKPNSKKGKSNGAGKPNEASNGIVKDAKEKKSLSPRKKKDTLQSAKAPKKSATKDEGDDKVTSCSEKKSPLESPPNTSHLTASERGKIYRDKKRKYFEDLQKEVEDLRTENKILKTTVKDNSDDQNPNYNTTDKGMCSDTNDLQNDEGILQVKRKSQEKNKEMSLFIQDLKDEIQQLQREKEKLISVEDMESIVNDLKEQVNQLKNQKKDLEMKEKETDSIVCDLRQELEQLKKQNEELETQRKDKSANKDLKEKIAALEKKNFALKSKEKELELFVDDLKKDVKDLTAEREGNTKSNEEMKLLVDRLKDEINALKRNKEELVSKEKEMKLNLKDMADKFEGLKKQTNDHENNARKTDFVIRSLNQELNDLKREKEVCEGNAKEMESNINKLESEIGELRKQKKEQEIALHNVEKERVSHQSNTKQMNLVISNLKSEISKLEEDNATYQSSVKELECTISKLEEDNATYQSSVKELECTISKWNEEVSNLKMEKGVLEKKQREMDSFIKNLTNENVELKNKVKNKGLSAQEQERKADQLSATYDEIVAPITNNTNIADGESSILPDEDHGQEVMQLRKDKVELKQTAGKLGLMLQDIKSELDHLKYEKQESKRSSQEMVTVMQSIKEELFKLKSKEGNRSDDVMMKGQVQCLTAQDMSHFVKDLKDEIGYLKGLIINQSELSALAKHVSTFPGFTSSEVSSGKRKLDCVSDDDTGNENKRQKSGSAVSTVKPAGVCLHVNNGKMSVEFCTTCSKSSSS